MKNYTSCIMRLYNRHMICKEINSRKRIKKDRGAKHQKENKNTKKYINGQTNEFVINEKLMKTVI